MKLKHTLITLFLLVSSATYAQMSEQDSLIQHYNKYPQQAIKDADSLYQLAVEEDNHELLIKSLILKTTVTLKINQDEYPRMIKELEAYIAKTTNIQVKSILHSYVGELYKTYYESNRYKIEERSELKGEAPDDINVWSSNLFWNKINKHLLASIASKGSLQKTPISDFNSILIVGKYSKQLRPTLYDFLCHRAIKIFSSLRFSDLELFYNPNSKDMLVENGTAANNAKILSPIDTFLSYDIPTTQLSPNTNTLRVWQELLCFRQQRSKSNADALLFADLERLKDAHEISDLPTKDSLYLQTLALMQKKYIGNPMLVEIMADEAKFLIIPHYIEYRFSPYRDKIKLSNKERALAICEKGIQKYPNYPRINILKDIIQKLKTPQAGLEFPSRVYPKDKLSIKINYRNIKDANIFIYRIHTSMLDYEKELKKKKSDISKTLVYKNSLNLAYNLIDQDTVLPIEIAKTGLYEVVVKVEGAEKDISDTFICSELFTAQQTTNKQFNFQTCDWQSGKLIKDVKILIYTKSYSPSKYKIIDSVYTDKQGLASYLPEPLLNNYSYRVVNSKNENDYLTRISNSYRLSKKISNKSKEQIDIITDRKIYRPGQTVLFKGFTWEETLDGEKTIPNKSYEIIFRDAYFEEITKKQFTTNQFGSFTGSFVIPQPTSNGWFSISINRKTTYFQVADYKRPEFEINLSEQDRYYSVGDAVNIKGNVKSFSGINLSNTIVKYNISNIRSSSSHISHTIQGVTQTDANGLFELSFKTKERQSVNQMHSYAPYTYQVSAKVTDSKGETQEQKIYIHIFTSKIYTSINIPEQVDKNKATNFRILLKDISELSETHTVKYTLAKLSTPKMTIETLDTVVEKTVLSGELKIATKDSIQPNLSHLPSGRYLFTVDCNNNKSKKIFYLYSTSDKHPPIPTYKWLVEEKTKCKPGETARVQFGTSAKDAYVIYEVYSPEKLLERKFVKLSNEIINIEIPYLAEYGRKIWLDIKYVKDKHYIKEIITIEGIYDEQILDIQTTVFRDKLQPGEKEEWKLKVVGANKKPAFTEVLAMMYDASLDKIAAYNPHIYLRRSYASPYFWDAAHSFRYRYSTRLPYWIFKHSKLDYPAFQFDKLNLFENFVLYDALTTKVSFVNTMGYGGQQKVSFVGSINNDRIDELTVVNEEAPKVDLRQNFQETAFFYPQLQTDATGTVEFSFKVPDALTKWKFIAIANTTNMAIGRIERYITTSKPLMVRPNLPRFFRSGDRAQLKVTISNLSDTIQKGIASIEFLTANNKQVVHKQQHDFNVTARQNQTLDFNFDVPENMEFTICRITAISGNFSDGEQHLIPILPDETLVTETLPIYMTSAGEHTYSFDKSSSNKDKYRLTFELTSNPIWYAVLALPTLAEPTRDNVTEIAASYYVNSIAANIARSNPRIIESIRNWNITKDDASLSSKLEQNSELKSILLEASPWTMQAQNESERIQSLIQLFDENRLKYLQTQAIEKLADLQTTSGGWSWFKGMYPSRFMTLNVLTILHRTSLIAQVQYGEQEKRMQTKALRYLDNQIKNDFEKPQKQINYYQIIYLHTRSLYRDIPLGDALSAHKKLMSLALKQWSDFSLYEKALTAIAMKNYGFTKEANNVLKSLRQYAIISPTQGMYWPNNRNRYYRNSAVLEHTAIMEAFQEIEGNSQDLNLMKQWLLRQKQVQAWGSAPATVNAIYALLLTGDKQLSSADPISVQLGKHAFKTDTDNNPLGYIKKSYQAGSIEPNMLSVEIKKESNTPSWGGMYLQYFEKLDQVKQQKTGISVNKELFIANMGANGKQEITPIDKQELTIGSKVIIRLTISLKSDMEFLHLKDLRAACFETVEQLSGIHWNFGSVYYQDIKDASTNFFFNALSKGTYIIEYPVWVNQSGTYQGGIATFQSIYSPEFNAFSSATKIEIK